MDGGALVRVAGLRTYFDRPRGVLDALKRERRRPIRAVDGIDLEIRRGEALGLVGESGSGKTTLARTILGLVGATAGGVFYEGRDIVRLSRRELRALRGRMQMVSQDPHSSLSPRLRVSYLLTEAYRIHHVPLSERYSIPELLEMVELADDQATKYPHELSGGQARRVGIARALSLHPDFLVVDEPTEGLDVSVAAGILNLMKRLGATLGLTYLIITHNLNLVSYIADRIAVMYLGRLAEVGTTDQVFLAASHPYTRALLAAVSEPNPRLRQDRHRLLPPGEIPSPHNPPPGCRFHPRCSYAEDRCRVESPQLEEIEPGHFVACHYWVRVRADRR